MSDSSWPGASWGRFVKKENSLWPVELKYRLKATELWPWPEIDFYLQFDKPLDFSRYSGLELMLSSNLKAEVYFYLMVEDQNLKILKPLAQRFKLNARQKQKVVVSFSGLKIPGDWKVRNAGYSGISELNKVFRLGLHKKGRDLEEGEITVEGIRLIDKRIDENQQRVKPPKHYFFDFNKTNKDTAGGEILISESELNQINPYFYGANCPYAAAVLNETI